jgi:hypothetical protein
VGVLEKVSNVFQRIPVPLLAAANVVCAAVSIAIVYFAVRDWPARYASQTLSWSVVLFFLLFVVVTVVGAISTTLYAYNRQELLLKLAAVPSIMLSVGFALGLLKASVTGDF